MALDAKYAVYALSSGANDLRYVGFTGNRGIGPRLASHRWEARHGTTRNPYPWMREVGPEKVVAVVLEKLPVDSSKSMLVERETYWIERLRSEGHDLLNVGVGHHGRTGQKLPQEQRDFLAEKARREGTDHMRTPEALARKIAATTGRKRGPYKWKNLEAHSVAAKHSAHNRWHTARGISKPETCGYCRQEE